MSNRVIHFEIHAKDPARAVKFYQEIFAWEINRWGEQEYWLISTGPDSDPGINGAITKRTDEISGEGLTAYVCTIEVDSVNETVGKINKSGGLVTIPKMPVTGIGWIAYCKDTEGNTFGIMQRDEAAK